MYSLNDAKRTILVCGQMFTTCQFCFGIELSFEIFNSEYNLSSLYNHIRHINF